MSYYDQCAFPKKVRPTEREARNASYRQLRPATREAAWQQDEGRCIFPTCRRSVTIQSAHAHEVQFRSDQGDPLDIDNVVTLCAWCHGDIHVRVGGKLKRIDGSRAAGLRFYQRASWRDAWVEV